MFILITSIALILSIIIPGAMFILSGLSGNKVKTVLGINIFSFFSILIVATIVLFSGDVSASGNAAAAADAAGNGLAYLAAALVTGMATIGAGIAVAAASSAALGAISEDPKIMGKALIFVALAEGIALYGLLVTFSILNRI
ncbi:MAG: V/A-type H+/Na+-transporting ATPase subunit [Clostridiales bacterium]|jgi:V/A-type H+-transporting ATPase subunit K|nr:ATPase [Clostridia bacterium]MDK2809667.1 V/A-type H+/Na+-transporting ATPase subunit [Petroclostridium sp.]MDK2932660.1 V/A-type H+/Na+-transporting ATPase subunit [Clostridiales bacterium]